MLFSLLFCDKCGFRIGSIFGLSLDDFVKRSDGFGDGQQCHGIGFDGHVLIPECSADAPHCCFWRSEEMADFFGGAELMDEAEAVDQVADLGGELSLGEGAGGEI